MGQPDRDVFTLQNPQWQHQLQGVALASFRARACAFAVDWLWVALLSLACGWVGSSVDAKQGSTAIHLSFDTGALSSAVVAVLYFGLCTWLGRGATPGKKLLRIRVVSLVHPKMSLWHCIERAMAYSLSFLEFGLGFFQYFKHPNHQTVHDRVAETIVVRA